MILTEKRTLDQLNADFTQEYNRMVAEEDPRVINADLDDLDDPLMM